LITFEPSLSHKSIKLQYLFYDDGFKHNHTWGWQANFEFKNQKYTKNWSFTINHLFELVYKITLILFAKRSLFVFFVFEETSLIKAKNWFKWFFLGISWHHNWTLIEITVGLLLFIQTCECIKVYLHKVY